MSDNIERRKEGLTRGENRYGTPRRKPTREEMQHELELLHAVTGRGLIMEKIGKETKL